MLIGTTEAGVVRRRGILRRHRGVVARTRVGHVRTHTAVIPGDGRYTRRRPIYPAAAGAPLPGLLHLRPVGFAPHAEGLLEQNIPSLADLPDPITAAVRPHRASRREPPQASQTNLCGQNDRHGVGGVARQPQQPHQPCLVKPVRPPGPSITPRHAIGHAATPSFFKGVFFTRRLAAYFQRRKRRAIGAKKSRTIEIPA